MAPGHENDKETFIEEKTICFKERFDNFINETYADVNKRLYGYQRTRQRIVVILSILEKSEAILKKEQDKTKEALAALVGFDIEGTGKLPVYKERKVEIDDSPTAYACTDESIPSFF